MRASFSLVDFYDIDGNGATLMELQAGWTDFSQIRVPCIGEHIRLSSHEGDRVYKFEDCYEVVDIETSYSENRQSEMITVQYHVFVKKCSEK